MKRILLSTMALIGMAAIANAQVEFAIGDCSDNAGGYEIEISDGTDWSSPDMTDPANLLQGGMVMADDSLGCEAPINAAEIAGNIAVVYRGACQFGTKALNMQNAGATGCMIINHSPGVVPMGGGDDGLDVTIPVWMISNSDGAILADDINAGLITEDCVIQGNMNGFFDQNLRMNNNGVLRPDTYGKIALLSQDESEFAVETGAWVFNFGTSEETAAVLNVQVTLDGNVIFDEDSSPVSIPNQDSAFIAMPVFDQSSYPEGNYEFNYTVSGSVADEFDADNVKPANFHMGNVYSYGRLNPDGSINPTNHTSAGTPVGDQNYCIFFSDPNASRVVVTGFEINGDVFTGVIDDLEVETVVYEWNDEYAGTATTILDVSELDSEQYAFETGEEGTNILVPFDTAIELDDDQNYLFCLRMTSEELRLPFDNKTDYEQNVNLTDVPVFPYFDEAEAFTLGFGTDLAPGFSVQMASVVGLDEQSNQVDITPYPNPAHQQLTIPFSADLRGQATVRVFSIEGKLVSQQVINVTTSRLVMDVSDIPNGTYTFNLQFEDTKESTFNVVVNR